MPAARPCRLRAPFLPPLPAVLAAAALGGLAALPAGAQDGRRATLDNGAVVLMLPVPGTGRVAAESFYGVGFVHEPAGLPQAAHLLEHLLCNAATSSYEPGESMALLGELGMANAETMPSWTHYDYEVPAGELETVVRIEAERLGSLVVDEAILRQEGPRCCREVDFVERNPRAGMLKFAFMALSQAWRHGRTEARIRSGLEAYPVEAMERFRRQCYRPDNLVLVIVGDFDPDAALAMARKHLGTIASPDVDPPAPIDWSKAPRRSTVRWDSGVRAVCLAFPPPEDALARAVLSLWGSTLAQRLKGDERIQAVTHTVFAPTHTWSVGELPFFVYAAVAPDVPLEEVEALLAERLAAAVESGGGATPATIAAYARGLAAATQRLRAPAVRQSARYLEQQQKQAPDRAMGMVLGQGALNWGMADAFLGPDPAAAVAALESLTAEDLAAILREHLAEDRRIVTWLLPEEEAK